MHWLYSGVQEHACLPPPGCTGPGKRLRQAEQSIIQAPPALIEQEWQRFQAADAPGLSKPVSGTEYKWEALLQLRPTSSPVGPARLVGETLFQGRSTEGPAAPTAHRSRSVQRGLSTTTAQPLPGFTRQ